MARNREPFAFNGMGMELPDAGVLLDAQRAAGENAARMAGTACHYAMSVNRAWINFWSNHLGQYTEIPKRFAEAQTSFMERAFEHYQESMQELSGLAEEFRESAQEAILESGKAGERAAQKLVAEAKETGKASRPKESRVSSAGAQEERRGAH